MSNLNDNGNRYTQPKYQLGVFMEISTREKYLYCGYRSVLGKWKSGIHQKRIFLLSNHTRAIFAGIAGIQLASAVTIPPRKLCVV